MNAYAIGRLAGMQKQALSTKQVRRMLRVLKGKPAPVTIHHHDQLDKLMKGVASGKSVGADSMRYARGAIRGHYGYPISSTVGAHKLAPVTEVRGSRATHPSSVWRGTSAYKLNDIPNGSPVYVSGEPSIATMYAAQGGERPMVLKGRLLMRMKSAPSLKLHGDDRMAKFTDARRASDSEIASHEMLWKSPVVEGVQPFDPTFSDVEQAWRLYGDVSSGASGDNMLASSISGASLRKWLEAIKG